jgi:cysteinyl-tRNA synthetase
MIQVLVNKGMAYAVDGDVYFRVRESKDYGKLGRRDLDTMMAGARVEIDERKEDLMDFSLWKSQKPGEPAWAGPWGLGRPGWHIECSAMSLGYLGATVDIHGGGQDLVFPHHENEIAQTEAYTGGEPMARFWMHNGLMRLGGDKMSKSLGNLVTVGEALERFSSDALRLFFLSSHYRGPLTYSDEGVEGQERAAERLRNAVNLPGPSEPRHALDAGPFKRRFNEAMDDDLNTPRAIAVLFDLAHDINRAREEDRDVGAAQATVKELAGVLGLTLEEGGRDGSEEVGPLVELLIESRAELRAAKLYDKADQVRDRLADLGYLLEDTPRGTEWKRRGR